MSENSDEVKQVLITGSSTGIGLSCLKKFLKHRWKIVAHFYEDSSEFANLCETNADRITAIKADFGSELQIHSFLHQLESLEISVLVNVAGCFDFSKRSPERIQAATKIFCINTIAPFLIAESVFRQMQTRNFGHVVNISSIGVKYGSGWDHVFYGASKAALESVSKTMAREGAKHNILVNTIRPGVVDTEFIKKTGKDIQKRMELIPLKRAARPEEIAELVYFLSNNNTYITGQIIAISGGE